jgi:hypothetical protein
MNTQERKSLIRLLEATGEAMQSGLPAAAALEIAIADELSAMPQSLREALADAGSPGADPALRLAGIAGANAESWLARVEAGAPQGAGLALIAEALPRARRLPGGAVLIIADLAVLAVLSVIVTFFIAPTWIELFSSMNMTLPAPTRVAVAVAYAMIPVSAALVGLMVVAQLWLRRAGALGPWAARIDRLLLNLPAAGDWLRTRETVRAARWLALSRGAELGAFDAMAEAGAGTLGGRVAARVAASLREGKPLPETLESAGAFLPGFARVLRTADAHEGQPIARFLARYAQIASQRETGSRERLILAAHFVTGVVIGSYVFAIYLPLFKMGSAI